ncbi:MAG: UDP-N-acetylmuramoyl-L-alanine--D-glutamate ligase [Deltaproteobacteria bacterium]|nr:UDP-N-acetylmuramoyl-L-alanine--D-glutamate ligase [Deltaproteobacteria bacterium]
MALTAKNILIIGLGKTGIATARFLAKQKARIVATDQNTGAEIDAALNEIRNEDIPVRATAYDHHALDHIDMVIPSPGVPPYDPLLVEALRQGIPIHSELEIASRFLKPPMVAITGTNGKTTTTTLVGQILKDAGKRVFVGGNIGIPLIQYCDSHQKEDFVIVEVSSFQLQWVSTFRARCAVLLNAAPDHLNYHGSLASYRETKERIFLNQDEKDLAILNADEEHFLNLSKRLPAKTLFFSSTRKVERGLSVQNEGLVLSGFGAHDEIYPREMIKLPGLHNAENVMAAVMASRMCGCLPEQIVGTISNFRGLPHRIEFVGEKRDVAYYDDSKGTNAAAVARALETFQRPVVLLVGGRDKDGNFEILQSLIRKHVKTLILFGEARNTIKEKIGGLVETGTSPSLEGAVEEARRRAQAGDVVLLSPGCASFDEFADYRERGEFFQTLVRKL